MYNLEEIIQASKKMKLLYVEDNKEARTSTATVLKELFDVVIIAVDGEDGVSKFNENAIDLIITDISMPKCNGLDMIEIIKKQNKHISTLLLSAYTEIEYFKRSIELGVDGYLFKPLDMNQFLNAIHKVIAKVSAEKKLQENFNFLEQYEALTNETAMVAKTDIYGKMIYVNDIFCRVSGYDREELLGKSHAILEYEDNFSLLSEEILHTIKNKKEVWRGIVRHKAKNFSSYYVDLVVKPIMDLHGNIIEYIEMGHDISDVMSQQKQLHDFLHVAKNPFMAKIQIEDFDNLQQYYGLAFSSATEENLARMLEHKMSETIEFEAFFVLNNGTYAFVKDMDAEIDIQDTIESLRVFQKLINSLKIRIKEIAYDVSILIAISYKNNVYENVEYGMKHLVQKRDTFLVTNTIAIEVHDKAQKNLEILRIIKKALDSSNIVSYFQAIVDKNGKIEKYESLVRLIQEDGTVLSPYYFINIAKKGKYYTKITSVVLANSFKALDRIDTSISMNLSAIDIEKEEIREEIYTLLAKYAEKSKRVVFELLEDEDVKDFALIKDFITKVKSFGVTIAIDDFGSGYSNYERLLDYQPDIVKIDGSLVKNIETSAFSVSIVTSIVQFAKDQGLQVIAEYVENENIFHILQELGVEYFQGYYFSKPAAL